MRAYRSLTIMYPLSSDSLTRYYTSSLLILIVSHNSTYSITHIIQSIITRYKYSLINTTRSLSHSGIPLYYKLRSLIMHHRQPSFTNIFYHSCHPVLLNNLSLQNLTDSYHSLTQSLTHYHTSHYTSRAIFAIITRHLIPFTNHRL